MFEGYKGNGLQKHLRPKLTLNFKSFEESMIGQAPLDDMTYSADFEKFSHSELSHLAFATLDAFMMKHNGEKPNAWSIKDASEFLLLAKAIKETTIEEQKLLVKFAFTARGVFNPLCAFFGGFVAQEVIKAITGKFSPIK